MMAMSSSVLSTHLFPFLTALPLGLAPPRPCDAGAPMAHNPSNQSQDHRIPAQGCRQLSDVMHLVDSEADGIHSSF